MAIKMFSCGDWKTGWMTPLLAYDASSFDVTYTHGHNAGPGARDSVDSIFGAGRGTAGTERVRPGEVWLLPDSGEMPAIRGAGRFLRTWVPG